MFAAVLATIAACQQIGFGKYPIALLVEVIINAFDKGFWGFGLIHNLESIKQIHGAFYTYGAEV